MLRRPPRSTRTDTRFPYTTLFRSEALIPFEDAVAGSRTSSQIPAICDIVEATPEGDLPEADGGDLRNATQHRNYCFNVLGTVEFIDIDLPEVVAGSALGIGAALLVLFRSEEHTSELQSLMRISYAVFCLKK